MAADDFERERAQWLARYRAGEASLDDGPGFRTLRAFVAEIRRDIGPRPQLTLIKGGRDGR